MLVSAVQRNESGVCIHIYPPSWTSLPPLPPCVCVCVCVLVAQSCPTLCDPMDCSSPGFSIHGNFQAGILEWVPFNAHRHREKTLHCELTDMRPILGAREERKPTNRKPVVSPPNRGTSAAPRLGLPEQGAADRSVPLRNLVASQRL